MTNVSPFDLRLELVTLSKYDSRFLASFSPSMSHFMLVMTGSLSLAVMQRHCISSYRFAYLVSHFSHLSLTVFVLVTLAECDFLGFLDDLRRVTGLN